jgi:hypothetical protein
MLKTWPKVHHLFPPRPLGGRGWPKAGRGSQSTRREATDILRLRRMERPPSRPCRGALSRQRARGRQAATLRLEGKRTWPDRRLDRHVAQPEQ